MAQTKGILERVFKLSEKGTTVKTEILAGLTTFVAMAYIIFVNPSILADAGIPKEAAIAATVWSAVIGSAAMGLWANFPVAVAPGMGLNAFFAYYVCGVLGLHWTVALGAVFFSGIVFLLLTVTHVRQLLIDAVPMNLKYAIVVGIGMFIAFIGLQNAGIVVKNDATVVALGHVTQPGPLLACCGLMLTAGLMARNVQGSLLIGILVTAVLGMVFGVSPAPSGIDSVMSFSLPSLAPTLMQLDIMGALKYGIISIIFTFTIVELFDNMGTLIGLSRKARLMDDKGHIENLDKALVTDSVGTVVSSFLGTSTVTSYVESAAGISQGGRTGLTALVTGIMFLLTIFLAPLFVAIPYAATGPALIYVGFLMLKGFTEIDFTDFDDAIGPCVMMMFTAFTGNITNGLGAGIIVHVLVKLVRGKAKEIHPIMYLLCALMVLYFIVG